MKASPMRTGRMLALSVLSLAIAAGMSGALRRGIARLELAGGGLRAVGAELLAHAASGDAAGVDLLLRAGVAADFRDSWRRTALHLAAWGNHADVVSILIARGADVNARDAQGRTPLQMAAARGLPDLVKLLLAHGADPGIPDRYRVTPLHRALWSGNPAVVEILLSRGVDVRGADREGDTPLHLAVRRGDVRMVEKLLERGADPNARRSDGSTPLHFAVMGKHGLIVSILLAAGARASAADENGTTPLHRAAWSGNAPLVHMLLRAGANVHARDAEGRTPLHRLGPNTSMETLRLLLEGSNDINAPDGAGRTPLEVAIENGESHLARLLRACGGRTGQPAGVLSGSRPGAPIRTRPGGDRTGRFSPAWKADPPPDVRTPPAPSGRPHLPEAFLAPLRGRIRSLLARGVLPLVDIHFHYGDIMMVEDVLDHMERNGVALIWLGDTPRLGSRLAWDLHAAFPDRFVPITVHGQELPWIRGDPAFLESLHQDLASGGFFGMGEFECRHYATYCNDRDVYTRVDSPQMAYVLALSSRYRVPVLLHHEGEDRLLPELERMLSRYPQARVVWCHVGRTRNTATWKSMTQPGFIRALLRRHPNLYFDMVQPPQHPHDREDTVLFDREGSKLTINPAWRDLILEFPDRFLVGSDVSSTRFGDYDRIMQVTRSGILAMLPDAVAARVAFKNAWFLMSGEAWRD